MLNKFFMYSSYASIILPFIIGVRYYSKLDKLFRQIFAYICLEFLIETTAFIMMKCNIHNVFIYNSYVLIEGVWTILILKLLITNRRAKKFIYPAIALYALLWIATTFFYIHFNRFNYFLRSVESLIIVLFSGIAMLSVSNETEIDILKNSKFIYITSKFFYFSVTLFVFGISNLMLNNKKLLVNSEVWLVHSIINIISNIILMLSLWYNSRRKNYLLYY